MDYHDIAFSHVIELATRLNRRIVVFDLEANGFRGNPNFGITEIACFLVRPGGPGVVYGQLINPEAPLPANVQRLTGITEEMVREQETWGVKYARHFQELAAECWLTGFNIKTFDLHAVKDMNAKYGYPIKEFPYVFDVRDLHLDLTVADNRRGTLEEVAAMYGVKARGNQHRAQSDVIMTLETLDEMIAVFGVEAVLERILPKPEGAFDKLTAQAIARFARGKSSLSVEDVAKAFAVEPRKASYELGRAIDELLVNPLIFGCAPTQNWLDEALVEVETDLLAQGKLKPLYEHLLRRKPETVELDYVQLRVALHRAGLSWNSRKPA